MNYVRENFFEIIPTKELAKSWKGGGRFSIVKMYVRDEDISEVEITRGRRYRREKVGVCMIAARRPRPSLSTAWATVIVAGGGWFPTVVQE